MISQYTEEYTKFRDTSYCWWYMDRYSILKQLNPRVNKNTVALDLGCGSGHSIQLLLDLGVLPKNITGVDLSADLLKIAEQKLSEEVTLIQGNIVNIALEDNTFDVIISNMVFEDLSPKEWAKLTTKMHKWLKRGGLLVFNVVHPFKYEGSSTTYFSNKPIKGRTPWGVDKVIYPKTFTQYLGELINVGFIINSVEENIPTKEGLEKDKVQYQRYSKAPSRLTVSAING